MLKKIPVEPTGLEKAIDDLLSEMKGFTAETDEYARMADHLERLYKLKEIDKPCRVSPDTWAIIAGNLIGIAMIVGYERTNIVTSKALNFLRRL